MKTPIQVLEDLFCEKIMLYQGLVECLKEERQLLIKADIDSLWGISDKKHTIVRRIETIRGEILAVLSEAYMDHSMDLSSFHLATVVSKVPDSYHTRFKKLYSTLVNLQSETSQRSRENMLFVEESLNFLDDLIKIVSNAGTSDALYDNGGALNNKSQSNLLLHREV